MVGRAADRPGPSPNEIQRVLVQGEAVATLVETELPRPRSGPVESCRVWLFKTLFTNLCGITFQDWWEVLRENRFAVDPGYWPRASILTAGSLLNSWYRWREDRRFEEELRDDLASLRPEEAAVLTLLEARLKRDLKTALQESVKSIDAKGSRKKAQKAAAHA